MNLPLRRPLVGLAIAVAAGVAFGLRSGFSSSFGWAAILAAMVPALSWLAAKQRQPPAQALNALTYALVFLAAWAHAGQCRVQATLAALARTPARFVRITGIVADDPAAEGTIPIRHNFRLRVETSTAIPRIVRVQWTGAHDARRPAYGERWTVTGRWVPPGHGRREGLLLATPRGMRFHSAGHGHPIVKALLRARRGAALILSRGLASHPEQSGMIQALLLGYRHGMSRELIRQFAATGTLHIFAISGAHVVIVAGLINAGLAAAGLSRHRWFLALGPLLILYTVATGLQPSAIRATLMALTFWAAPLMRRRPDAFTAVAFAAVVMLAVSPEELGRVGFLMSFGVTLGLLLLFPSLEYRLPGHAADAQTAGVPEPVAWRLTRFGWRMVRALAIASLAAWLVSAPLTAYFFGLFSPIALVGNLFVIPMASLMILAGLLSLAGSVISPILSETFNHANLALATVLRESIRLLDGIPGGHWEVPPPSPWLIAAWYVVLLVAVAQFAVDRETTAKIEYGEPIM